MPTHTHSHTHIHTHTRTTKPPAAHSLHIQFPLLPPTQCQHTHTHTHTHTLTHITKPPAAVYYSAIFNNHPHNIKDLANETVLFGML